ncbi:MAG TPA: M23 family metallopeptidase [Desulfitobacteriaceae bacterium]|nr:M23 family metallopeptidase [Desulfitobacteriaceae bacterium]
MKLIYLKQLFALLVLAICAWLLLHYHKQIPDDVYPYLLNLAPELILECQTEADNLLSDSWSDLLAVKSSLPEDQVAYLTRQIKNKTPLKSLDWGRLDNNWRNLIRKRKSILENYPYFKPSQYAFPVSGKVWYEDSFGADREGGTRKHEGTDLFGQEGTPIISVCPGIIERLGWNRLGGERVGVRGDDGNYYYYAHLQQISPQLKVGNSVQKGEYLGAMGHTGDALTTPDHLHFGIELADGKWINPYTFLVVWQGNPK